jgi:hypothetical protein
MKATPKAVSKAVKSTMVAFAVSESVILERKYNGIAWQSAFDTASNSKAFDESIILGIFIGKPVPTWDDYKAEFKKKNPKESTPTKRSSNAHNAIYQKLTKAAKIQEAIENGFKPLEAWNDEAHKSKRSRIGDMTMDGIFKLAKPFLPNTTETESAEVIAFKRAKGFYKALQECKGKQYQTAFTKLEALATGLGWVLADEVETDTDTEE